MMYYFALLPIEKAYGRKSFDPWMKLALQVFRYKTALCQIKKEISALSKHIQHALQQRGQLPVLPRRCQGVQLSHTLKHEWKKYYIILYFFVINGIYLKYEFNLMN